VTVTGGVGGSDDDPSSRSLLLFLILVKVRLATFPIDRTETGINRILVVGCRI